MSPTRRRRRHMSNVRDCPLRTGFLPGYETPQSCKRKTAQENPPKKTQINRPKFRKNLVPKRKCLFSAMLPFPPSTCQKKRKYDLSARSGLADKRLPPQDNNTWKTLIDSRQGYMYSARILLRIFGLLRRNGIVSHSGPTGLSP